MFVPNSLPVKSVSEFIAYGKANKGKLTLASPARALRHIFVASCSRKAGLDMIHVPYRGAAPAMNDLIPGRVHLLFSGGATLDNARSGQVQVLGYTGAKRSAIASNVPTIAESGVPGFDVCHGMASLCRPKPQPRSSRKSTPIPLPRSPIRAFMDAWRRSVTRAARRSQSVGASLRAEVEIWSRVIKQAGIGPEK